MKNIKSKSHKHKKEFGTVVENCELYRPDTDEVNYVLNDTI